MMIHVKKHHLNLPLYTLIIVFLFSCAKKEAPEIPEEQVLARVGDRIITADEFKYSYEFSLATLRKGEDSRRTYLNNMIKELILANEGYRLGFDKNPYVINRLNIRRESNLLQAFVKKHVHEKVRIPEEDLQDAIKKGTVKFRMIIWPTASLEEAEMVRDESRKTTLEDYVEAQLAMQEVRLKEKRFYETDWIDFLEMPPEIFIKIEDLDVGETSQPFPLGDGYAVAQVLDINLQGITEDELLYGSKRKKMKARLHNIEADKIMHELMDSLLTPLDIRVKGNIVEQLAIPLYQWIQDGLPRQRSVFTKLQNPPDTAKAFIKEVDKLFDETLVTYNSGQKYVRDYLKYMDYYRKNLNESNSFEDFKNRLLIEIGNMMRDEKFLSLAEKEGFDDSAEVVQDLKIWEQKWTYEIYRHELVKNLLVREEEMEYFFKYRWRELSLASVDTTNLKRYENEVYNAALHEKYMTILENKINELKDRYPVWINEKLLYEIELTESTKSNPITVFVRRNFDGKPLLPTVDMEWLHF